MRRLYCLHDYLNSLTWEHEEQGEQLRTYAVFIGATVTATPMRRKHSRLKSIFSSSASLSFG